MGFTHVITSILMVGQVRIWRSRQRPARPPPVVALGLSPARWLAAPQRAARSFPRPLRTSPRLSPRSDPGARFGAALPPPRRTPQLAVAGLVIGLVATKLNSIHLGIDVAHLDASLTDTCLMGTGPNNVNLCYVAYGFAGVSVLATAALGLLLCCTCNLCGLGSVLDTIFALAGAAWCARARAAGRAARAGACMRMGWCSGAGPATWQCSAAEPC